MQYRLQQEFKTASKKLFWWQLMSV